MQKVYTRRKHYNKIKPQLNLQSLDGDGKLSSSQPMFCNQSFKQSSVC